MSRGSERGTARPHEQRSTANVSHFRVPGSRPISPAKKTVLAEYILGSSGR
eukprot:CAMPEP_0119526958 /NCGR_PEP_ID=MMETSP1344-20130328/41473_1 /TAXON_ID=236787 /ORGANISM="Florenciella parvula, Strain CCMP2471" /LENGTH=50 /DNA_ID=CAMNT_0007566067 /DNA_START=27 /DNA_END=176 /DNA_ORIENTATION=+